RAYLLADAHLAEAIDRLALAEILKLEQLADFDLAVLPVDRRIGEAPGPFQRLLARLHLDDGVAGDQLPGFGERAVEHAALAARIFDAPALGGRPQAARIEQHAGFHQLLVIVRHGGEQLLRRPDAGLGVLGGFDDNHETHGSRLLRFGRPYLRSKAGSTITSHSRL